MLIYSISVLFSLLLAFLCGAVPVALIIGKSMRGLDVREHGSGNAGSTNAIRVLGLGPGLLVFAGDVLKGVLGCVLVSLAVNISLSWATFEATQAAFEAATRSTASFELDPLVSILASSGASYLYDIPMAMAIVATILGHMFSPFMGFKGGKGVATALGAVAVVLPLTAACSLSIFILMVLIFRYISLGSIIAVITVPVFTALFYGSPTYTIFTVVLAIAVVLAHRKNIVRLSKGKEPKFSFSKKDEATMASPNAVTSSEYEINDAHAKSKKTKVQAGSESEVSKD